MGSKTFLYTIREPTGGRGDGKLAKIREKNPRRYSRKNDVGRRGGSVEPRPEWTMKSTQIVREQWFAPPLYDAICGPMVNMFLEPHNEICLPEEPVNGMVRRCRGVVVGQGVVGGG